MERVECIETYDFRNWTITLKTASGEVLREHRYTKETFPVVALNLPADAETVSQTVDILRPQAPIE